MTCALFHLGGCQGRMDFHHVLPKQAMKLRFKYGGVWQDGRLVPLGRTALVAPEVSLRELLDDSRNIVGICRRLEPVESGSETKRGGTAQTARPRPPETRLR